jgi:hypothetical protein
VRIKTKEQYQARFARRAPKKKTRTSDNTYALPVVDMKEGWYDDSLQDSTFNAPPMDNEERFVDIDTSFPLVARTTEHVAASQYVSHGGKMKVDESDVGTGSVTFEKGKKYRIRWDSAEKRDVVTEN